MANSRPIVALNVGSQRVSMGVFSKTSKDALILDRYATRLVVLDPSAEGLRLTKIGEAIAGLVQELNVKGSVVNYSVSGQSVFIRFVKLPALDDTDVEQLIRFEAQQHVPFPLDEVVWDYHLLPAKGLEREAILVAIKAEDLDSLNDEIVSHGLSTGKVDCALTSLYNAYVDSYPDEKEPVMLIDIGAKSTDLIYSEQGRFFTRSISAGGIFVTSAIAREFNISFMEAERLKTTSGLVSMSNGQTEGLDPATANLATVIRTAMTRLASEIQRTTNHYRAQMSGSAPVKAYLCGGGASLPYTKEFLEDKLGIPISFFNPMHNVGVGSGVDVNTISREAFILGGLIGTAIHSIGRASLNIDLETTAVAKKRANQKKMPAIIVGAAIAVLGAAAYAVTGYMGEKKAEEILAGVQPTVTSIKSAQSALRQKEQELKKLDSTLASYQQLTLQRYGYADIIRHLLEQSEHKDYPYWFTDFEPLAHFNPEDTTQITGYSVIKDSFTSDKNTSLVDDIRTEASANASSEDEAGVYSVNAIRLTGFVRRSLGGQRIIQDLQAKIDGNKESLFTFKPGDVKLEARQIMELGAKDAKVDAAAGAFVPFKLVLPLKTPIPVNFNK